MDWKLKGRVKGRLAVMKRRTVGILLGSLKSGDKNWKLKTIYMTDVTSDADGTN